MLGKKINTRVPLHEDERTYSPEDGYYDRQRYITIDSNLFGLADCSLQVKMQARNLEEACTLHDGLIALAPVMSALTAGTPAFKGWLAKTDTRWACFGQTVDDRIAAEIETGCPSCSTTSSSITYAAPSSCFNPEYQIQGLEFDQNICAELEAHGMHSNLARHFACILSRDPYASRHSLETADMSVSLVLDGVLAHVWQPVRLKPPSNEQTGWRVEFRPMEVQLTDFENAAFCVFVVLAAKLIVEKQLNLYVPLDQIDTSMKNASRQGAVVEEDYVFRCTSVSESEVAPIQDL